MGEIGNLREGFFVTVEFDAGVFGILGSHLAGFGVCLL